MNKFDELLNSKANEEKEKFTLPMSVDLNIEKTLEGLYENKKSKINKKALAMVASLAFVLLIGIKAIIPIEESNNRLIDSSKHITKGNTEESVVDDYNLQNEVQGAKYDIIYDKVLNRDGIISINIEALDSDEKLKVIENQEDINDIVSFINSISIEESNEVIINSWDFIIKTSGQENHCIKLKDNIMTVDDKWYEINSGNINSFKELYNNLRN